MPMPNSASPYREVGSFLRQAGVQFQRTATPCRSIAELDAQEAKLQQEALAKQQEQQRLEEAAREKALAQARERAEQDVYASRENAIAIAGVMLVLGGLSLGAAMMFHAQKKQRQKMWAGIGGGLLLAGAAASFFLRPSFSSIEEQIVLPPEENAAEVAEAPAAYDATGDNLCRIDESRSRITVSETKDIPVNWAPGGCLNGDTQYGEETDGWSRIFVPNTEAAVSINSFDPATGTYKVERFLADAATMEEARELRSHFTFKGCTADAETLGKLQQMQSEIRAVLPPQPNERLVYRCSKQQSANTAQE
jgi:hypothetical protein